MNKFISVIAVSLLFSSFQVRAVDLESTSITTVDIIGSMTLDSSCLNYCFTGVCVWLDCGWTGCSVKTSVRVSHYNPDLVVSVYDEPGENPWSEIESIFGSFEESMTDALVGTFHDSFAGGGHRTEGGNTASDHSLRFKEVAAIGHPFSSIAGFIASTGLYCPSEADSFSPYLLSSADALTWRYGLPEMLYLSNLLPGRRVVGSGFHQQWGAVWPRTGFINQKDDAKAAAVIAQRAGNIVTQPNQPHVYSALDGNGYNRTWLPGELRENDPETGVWRMLAPQTDGQCYAFGENDVYTQSWSDGRVSEDNRYAFELWRPYECCQDRGSWLFDVSWSICI